MRRKSSIDEIEEGPLVEDAGIVDQHRKRALALRPGTAPHRDPAGRQRAAFRGGNLAGGRLGGGAVAIEHDHFETVLGEAGREGIADPAGTDRSPARAGLCRRQSSCPAPGSVRAAALACEMGKGAAVGQESSGEAAVDFENRADDVGGFVAKQEGDRGRDFLGFGRRPSGLQSRITSSGLGGKAIPDSRRVDAVRRDRVDPYAAMGPSTASVLVRPTSPHVEAGKSEQPR